MATQLPTLPGITVLDWDRGDDNEDTHLRVDAGELGGHVTVILLTSNTYGTSLQTLHLPPADALRFADALRTEAEKCA